MSVSSQGEEPYNRLLRRCPLRAILRSDRRLCRRPRAREEIIHARGSTVAPLKHPRCRVSTLKDFERQIQGGLQPSSPCQVAAILFQELSFFSSQECLSFS